MNPRNGESALACALTVVPVVSVLDRVAPCPTGWVGRARPFVVALLGVHASLWEPASRIVSGTRSRS